GSKIGSSRRSPGDRAGARPSGFAGRSSWHGNGRSLLESSSSGELASFRNPGECPGSGTRGARSAPPLPRTGNPPTLERFAACGTVEARLVMFGIVAPTPYDLNFRL